MPGRAFKDKLVKGERVFGTFFQNAMNPAIVDVLPPDTLDFVIVTAEHSALELAEFLPIRYALEAKGIACLVRIHSRDAADVSKVCDTFDGVVVVNTQLPPTQSSVVQRLPSSQTIGVFSQTPFTQASSVQGLLSSHVGGSAIVIEVVAVQPLASVTV